MSCPSLSNSYLVKTATSKYFSDKVNRHNMTKILNMILKTGLIVGCFDILLAFIDAWLSYGVGPTRVLQFIASGLLGEKAFQQLYGPALLGLAIHFFIAFFWTALFFVIYRYYKRIVFGPLLQGVLYGFVIWLVMNLFVLPVSAVPKSEFKWMSAVKGILILIIAIGLPLAHFARRRYSKNISIQH